MATISTAAILGQGGDPSIRWAVLAIRKVTTGDTIDVSLIPTAGLFTAVFGAIFLASTERTQTPVVSVVAGTVITISTTGLAGDGGYLFVVGQF
jgi:hypothetical protein